MSDKKINKKLSTQEVKGTRDWLPDEFNVRHYIFDTWRQVCQRYGFEEYLTPLVEYSDIYRAKSGEDIGGKELISFKDFGERDLSIRPEMTPSVTRMVAKIYPTSAKPIKLFSIANFMRNEKPQRGRNREFWQLNCDIFGSTSLNADLEIMQLAIDLVLAFKPPKDSFIIGLNSRQLIEDVLLLAGLDKMTKTDKVELVRILDKWHKLTKTELNQRFSDLKLSPTAINVLEKFMSSRCLNDLIVDLPDIKEKESFRDLNTIMDRLQDLSYGEFIEFNPTVIRGFDYYDGIVFEVFDKHPKNNRAMFGGGRYNGLADIFGVKNFPALGFAPGDETMRLFLESWGLDKKVESKLSNTYYLPLLNESLLSVNQELAKKLRQQGQSVLMGLEPQKMNKALEFANKKGIKSVIILGEDEVKAKKYKLKDMNSGQETEHGF